MIVSETSNKQTDGQKVRWKFNFNVFVEGLGTLHDILTHAEAAAAVEAAHQNQIIQIL